MFANTVPLTAAPTTGSLNTIYTVAVIVLTLFGVGGVGGFVGLWRYLKKAAIKEAQDEKVRNDVLETKDHPSLRAELERIQEVGCKAVGELAALREDVKAHHAASMATHEALWAAIVESKKKQP